MLVPKYRGDTPKGAVPDDIRVCIDYIAVNERIKRLVDQYPDPQELLRKAAGYKYVAYDAKEQTILFEDNKDQRYLLYF